MYGFLKVIVIVLMIYFSETLVKLIPESHTSPSLIPISCYMLFFNISLERERESGSGTELKYFKLYC